MIVRKQYARAIETWAAAQIEPGYLAKNRVFDRRFVRPRTQGRLDWTLTANAHVEATVVDGLTLRFDGMENTAYRHLTHRTFLPSGR